MFDLILYQPEIPPNTGNIIRVCANTGTRLHLVEPLGFDMEDRRLRRAGLDYREWANVVQYASLDQCLDQLPGARVFACSTRGTVSYTENAYRPDDVFLFGPETRGLPQDLLANMSPGRTLRIPMRSGSRSLNLSNAVAVVLYEAWRQLEFEGGN
jgi:tRNA (cytidine/uridine-2'-O-)-methyltransferase